MRKSRFTEDQMVKSLREADNAPLPEVAKRPGVSEATPYAWRKRFGTMDVPDTKRLQALEAENTRLKRLVRADPHLDRVSWRGEEQRKQEEQLDDLPKPAHEPAEHPLDDLGVLFGIILGLVTTGSDLARLLRAASTIMRLTRACSFCSSFLRSTSSVMALASSWRRLTRACASLFTSLSILLASASALPMAPSTA
jgi:putative transposase